LGVAAFIRCVGGGEDPFVGGLCLRDDPVAFGPGRDGDTLELFTGFGDQTVTRGFRLSFDTVVLGLSRCPSGPEFFFGQ